MVKVITLPPPVLAARFQHALQTAPGAVEVTLPQLKPRRLNWRQVSQLHQALNDALTAAAQQTFTREPRS
jgi:hypothetical protein